MRLASSSIGQLAAALARAQGELVNPPKSLTGVIPDRGGSGPGRSFRYAPLSAGLEIVRQVLGQHELAVLQTTHVDEEGSLVLLTTTLAHGSGEWVASSWPVCRLDQLTNPQLMGAALTDLRAAVLLVCSRRACGRGRPGCSRCRGWPQRSRSREALG